MATFDYLASRSTADKLIKKFGMQASLSRAGVLRTCWVAVTKYNPRDPSAQLANPTDRNVVMSADLGDVTATPPDAEQDLLIIYAQPAANPPVIAETLRFAEPLEPVRPAGVTVVYLGRVRQ